MVAAVVGTFVLTGGQQVVSSQSPLRLFLLNAHQLQERKHQTSDAKTNSWREAILKLESDGQNELKTEVPSIVTKTATPPSGAKHDYMTQAPYFWKNPDTKDGFPYIQRDGERNPEIKQYPDHDLMDTMEDAVERLSFAYYFTGKEEYAARAADVLRMWFIDAKTRMNPNREFAQAIPGKNSGRGIGIIETRGLVRVVDAVGLLAGSRAWSKTDQNGVETWFAKYLEWLTTSKNGIDESNATNNHGTFYDVQVACFALFAGKTDLAKKVIGDAREKRIGKQIEPDGRQPRELARTKSWSYSTMNLAGMIELAELGDAAGVDLWSFKTPDGRSIRGAIEFLFPYATGEKKWTYQQIEEFRPESFFASMRLAAARFTDDKFKKMLSSVPRPPADAISDLLGR
jgi:Alginate lyase